MTALIPLPAKSFKPFHMSLKPLRIPFQMSWNLFPIASRLLKSKPFKSLPNFFLVSALMSSQRSERKSFDLFQVLDHLSWILSCVSLTLSASFETLFCVSSLMPSQVFAVDFLRLSQVLPTTFLVSSTFLLRPFLRSPAMLTMPLTNFRNFALSLYANAKPKTIGFAKIRILPIVVMTFLIVLPTFTKKSPTFLAPFLTLLTTLSVPSEIDFLKFFQPLDMLSNLSLSHLIPPPMPSLTDFAMPLQKSRNFLLCLYNITKPATKAVTPTIARANGFAIRKAVAVLSAPNAGDMAVIPLTTALTPLATFLAAK